MVQTIQGLADRGVARAVVATCLLAWGGMISTPAQTGKTVETDHLILQWTETPDEEEVAGITAAASESFAAVAELLGTTPAGKVTIVLGGPAEQPDGRWDYPRVDSMGRIRLFRYTPEWTNYLGALAHEMVHAFRFERRKSADWFFEEGFAEFIALRADPSLAGFPWFDFPVTVVAGQWLARDEGLPLIDLQARHRELNRKCRAQSYALRSSFFDWLGRTFEDTTVIQAAAETPAGSLADYEKFFGKSLEQLAADWRADLLAAYRRIPDVAETATSYRTESPIQYQEVCAAGK